MDKKIYYQIAINQIPRLLGQLDRNKNSKTFGCFDRNYWHYKITDFPCARHQESALTLAILYNLNENDNPYFKNKNVLEWVNAALNFWSLIQNNDGSFNEWYPNEHSFVATAFSSYTTSETLLLLKNQMPNKNNIIKSLEKAGNWLIQHNETIAMNQMSGAALTLLNIYLLTKNHKYLRASKEKLREIIKNQNEEGWWNEYNGADIGYLSLTIDYLSKYNKKTPDYELKNSINKAIDFLYYFVHPNLTFGGEYGSRNTEYMIPCGIELNARTNKKAAAISLAIRKSLNKRITIAPYSIDDRYLCYILYIWLQTYIDSLNKLKDDKIKYMSEIQFKKNFLNSKIFIISNKYLYLIINYSKGGVFSLFNNGKNLAYFDSGIILADENKNYLVNSNISDNILEAKEESIMVKGNFWLTKNIFMTPLKNIVLRTLQLTLGTSKKINFFVKKIFRTKLITKSKKINTYFTREFVVKKDCLIVNDIITSKSKIRDVFIGEKFSNIFIPSSRYFQLPELKNKSVKFTNLNTSNFKIVREFGFDGKLNYKFVK